MNPIGVDYETAYKLISEDVLIEQAHKGYAVKHDLYVDWALEYIVEQDFGKEENCVKILKEPPKSITYLNAFARWLMCIIDNDDIRVRAIMDALVRGDVDKQWKHCLLSCVGNSNNYATSFFSLYSVSLKEQNYSLFNQFVDVLDVSCKKVTQYFEYKGERYPVFKSVGKGWDEAVAFVFANRVDYYFNHLGSVQKLLDGYSSFGNKGSAMTQAAALSLYLFDYIAEIRKKDESIWVDGINRWCELTCKYAFGIRKELHEVFRQVIDNKWVRHRDPYAELISYILKDQNHVFKTMLYITCLDDVIKLMELFWSEQPEEDDQHVFGYSRSMESEHLFGLNEDDGIHMAFFPSSPYQTPIQMLFDAEQLLNTTEKTTKVIDFIVRFVNLCVDYYIQRCKYEQVVKLPVRLADGSSQMIIASQSLWNMYRGTANLSMPNVLESIHMALEVYLLDMTDLKKNPDWKNVKEILWRILTTSHSASIYSVVASVAVAHPDDLFDILLFLCQNIEFLALDLNRCSHEITSNSRSFIYNRHENWWTERDRSNKLPHRQEHLESVLLKSQVVYDNAGDNDSKQKLLQAYHVVDELKRQAANLNGTDSIYGFIAARIDYRSHKKREVVLKNGVVAVDANKKVVGFARVDGQIVDPENNPIGFVRPWGGVIDSLGRFLGIIVSDGSVVDKTNTRIAFMRPMGFAIDEKGAIVGGVVPQGVAVGSGCRSLGEVSLNGEVQDSFGQTAGHVLLDRSVVDSGMNELGAVIRKGLVIDASGKPLGFVNSEGKAVNFKGASIGCVNPDGTVFAHKNFVGAIMPQ